MSPTVKDFFDKDTFTISYVVYDENTRDAVIIDPVLNYDPAASKITHHSIKLIMDFCATHSLNVHLILETHVHADHITGSDELKRHFKGIPIAIGARITEVQSIFKEIYNLPESFTTDGSQFDILLKDNEVRQAGSLCFKTIYTPGHTPACASYLFDNTVFTGDALFMPDSGTGRCDFPAGDAKQLYHSIHEKLFALADSTRVYTCHDYQPGGRPFRCQSTIGEEKTENIQLKANTTISEFVEFRMARDRTLSAPRLLLPSLQVNINAGRLPQPEANTQQSFLKIPLFT